MKKIMVVSPHPDDETLGAGGFLIKNKKDGNQIYWLNVTNMKVEYGYNKDEVDYFNNIISKVKNYIGFDGFFDLGLKPACVDQYPLGSLIGKFKEILETVKPDVLIIPYKNDVHSDHRFIFNALYSCTKSFRADYLKMVLSMEIISETDQAYFEDVFSPNLYVNITDEIESKIKALMLYETEIGEAPFPRNKDSIRGLASYRGATANYKYGEAFLILKSRID